MTSSHSCNATAPLPSPIPSGMSHTPSSPQENPLMIHPTIHTLLSPFVPFHILSIITSLPLLSSFIGNDVFKILIFGGLFETCRRLCIWFYRWVVSRFMLTAYFEEDDMSYDWMMFWLSNRTGLRTSREVEISTRSWGMTSCGFMIPGEDTDPQSIAMSTPDDKMVAFLPCAAADYSLWWRGKRVIVTRIQNQVGYGGRREETLKIQILTFGYQALADLLLEAKREYKKAQQHSISIYVADSGNDWHLSATRPKRDIQSIVLDPGMKDHILEDARDFLDSKSWYSARGIPFRRGYLLYGAPGSGKTSIIHALAGELQLDVYIVSLSRVGMDDAALSELISNLPSRCIALMEDIDAAFHHGLNRENTVDSAPDSDPADQGPRTGNGIVRGPPSSGKLSLSGLLNALDGVGAQEGRILFATTNKYTSLDPALCRPGRMDLHIEFKLASKFQARELFRRFYRPDGPSCDSPGVDQCVGLNDDQPEKARLASDDDSRDSGYLSSWSSSASADNCSDESTAAPLSCPISDTSKDKTVTLDPHSHRGLHLSIEAIWRLSEQFADIIPERIFSMAALQGYLMMYKTRPFDAVAEVKEWVVKISPSLKDGEKD